MNMLSGFTREATRGVEVADRPEGLAAIRSLGCAAAIWRRQPLPGFQAWIDRLDPAQLPRARLVLRPTDVREAVVQVCDLSGTPGGPERNWLIDDITALADVFAGLMDPLYLRLRLDVVTTNACRRFHVDAIAARLVCTYRGTGTQYGISTGGADPQRVFTVATGMPMMMRGTLWPENPRSGLLHRSPPIEGSGEVRLLLVLDLLADPEDDA